MAERPPPTSRAGNPSPAHDPAPSPPSLQPFLSALGRGDAEALHAAFGELQRALAGYVAQAPHAARLFAYEVLRALSEAVRAARQPGTERARIELLQRLGGTPSADLVEVFGDEGSRLLERLGASRSARHPLAERARRLIEERAGERLSLAIVARDLGVARTYLSALFHRECGVTLTEYIHRVRIERAESLLRRGGMTLAEIAQRAGYGSYRHFHRSFLKLRQSSPRRFAQQVDGEAGVGAGPGDSNAGDDPPAWAATLPPLAARRGASAHPR